MSDAAVEPLTPVAPYWEAPDGQAVVYCADAAALLSRIDIPAVGTVVTDPPWWGMAFASALEIGQRGWNPEDEAKWLGALQEWYLTWLPHVRNIVHANHGRAWLFASPHHLPSLVRIAYLSHWPVRRLFYATESEALVQFGRPLPDGIADRVGRVFAETTHGNKTSPELLDTILRASGDGVVLDPFMGTGSVIIAARRLGLPAWGVEIREDVCALAVRRITGGGPDGTVRPGA